MSLIKPELLAQIAEGERVLAERDPKLGRLIQAQAPVVHEPRADYFWSLTESIVSQQLSVKAADTIFGRLEAATGIQPKRVLDLREDEGRALGLSRQKWRYLQDLAAKFVEDPRVYQHLERLGDDEVIADLTAVKGIGAWTAQMFLMFSLVRLDVFAPDDIGLQRAMKQLYGWGELLPRAELVRVAEAWRPYRTVAAWHLWRSLYNEPLPAAD
jgi:DNA-3-methyladenine glycosylase II